MFDLPLELGMAVEKNEEIQFWDEDAVTCFLVLCLVLWIRNTLTLFLHSLTG